jgi:hypothetical protein
MRIFGPKAEEEKDSENNITRRFEYCVIRQILLQ